MGSDACGQDIPATGQSKEEIFKKILEWHPTCLPLKDK